MPKRPANDAMTAEIKLRLSPEDRDRFKAEADKMRLTVSAWLRLAGIEKLEKKGGR
jgi:hypothetical protein